MARQRKLSINQKLACLLYKIHNVIYNELCQCVILEYSKAKYLEIIAKLELDGAEGVILGCTEIELLINAGDFTVKLYPTARIHD